MFALQTVSVTSQHGAVSDELLVMVLFRDEPWRGAACVDLCRDSYVKQKTEAPYLHPRELALLRVLEAVERRRDVRV